MKKALITGITGQDGSYLAELLLVKGYEVHGIIRKASTFNTNRIEHIYVDPHIKGSRFFLYYGDLSDMGNINKIISSLLPDEIYHLGAQSHVRVSFDLPEYTGNIDALGTTRLLEAIRVTKKEIKFYQASTSEIFGNSPAPQNENTPFKPQSPYACAKLYSYWMTENYREAYNIFAVNGILFNHESPRRGETFVTRKITRAIARILKGEQKVIFLGNLDTKRDWGYAPEYVEVMWKMLQKDTPSDYVIGTGESFTVRKFVEEAFKYVGINISWEGEGINEKGIINGFNDNYINNYPAVLSKGDVIIRIDPRYFRPLDPALLIADPRRAKEELGWSPKIKFHELVKIMVDYDLKYIGLTPIGEGIKISLDKGFDWTQHSCSRTE